MIPGQTPTFTLLKVDLIDIKKKTILELPLMQLSNTYAIGFNNRNNKCYSDLVWLTQNLAAVSFLKNKNTIFNVINFNPKYANKE